MKQSLSDREYMFPTPHNMQHIKLVATENNA